MTGSFKENLAAIFSESSVPSFAETYLSVGFPGDNLTRKKRKLIRRKRVSIEDNNLTKIVFTNCDFNILFIKSPLPAMD